MLRAPLLATLLLAVSGCLLPAPNESDAVGTESVATLTGPTTIVDSRVNLVGYEFDVQCRSGGGPEVRRLDDAFILPGTDRLDVTVAAGPGYTSIQFGYSVDGGEKTWLEPVQASTRTFEVPVPQELVERSEPRWTFWYQLNLPAAQQDCYTGVGTGERAFKVVAMPEA